MDGSYPIPTPRPSLDSIRDEPPLEGRGRGVETSPSAPQPLLIWHCGGDVLFRGRPIHMATARALSVRLRREACDEVSQPLWDIYHQARQAIADALMWRGLASINSGERRA